MSSVFLMLLEVTTISTVCVRFTEHTKFVELRNHTTCIPTEMLWSRKYEQMTLADSNVYLPALQVNHCLCYCV